MKDAYYFSHDSNAKDDPKCVMLIEQLGPEGYGIFWILVETLRDQPDYKYPLVLIPAIARRYNTTSEKIKAVVLKYQLFETTEDKFFFSESLIRRMEPLENKRLKNVEAGKISAAKRKQALLDSTHAQHMFNTCSTGVQPVKESKVEYSKEEKSIVKDNNTGSRKQVFSRPSKEDVIDFLVNEKNHDFFTAQGFADRFINYYDSNGWKVGKNQMKLWKAAVSSWLSKEPSHKPKNGLRNDSSKSLFEKHKEANIKLNQLINQES